MNTRKKIVASVLALAALCTTATAADATPFWAPARFSCGVGKNAILKFTVVNSTVIVGYGITAQAAGQTSNYKILSPGTRTISTGLNAGYWQKWADAGNGTISAASYSCVNFLFAPITP